MENNKTIHNKRKITIDYTDIFGDKLELEGSVLTHYHDIDGSQIILIKTERRKSVDDFLSNELINKKE